MNKYFQSFKYQSSTLKSCVDYIIQRHKVTGKVGHQLQLKLAANSNEEKKNITSSKISEIICMIMIVL